MIALLYGTEIQQVHRCLLVCVPLSVAHSCGWHALYCFCTEQPLHLFRQNFPMDNEQYCVMSCEQKPKEPTTERKASCVARSELNFQASRQDSCTRLEDLQPQPWGASEERLMHGYRCRTWEVTQEEAQMGTERGDHCMYTGDGDSSYFTVGRGRKETLFSFRCSGWWIP